MNSAGGDGGRPWEFRVTASILPSSLSATETIGSIAFDTEDRFMATAGIARKIKLYDVSAPDSGRDSVEDEEEEQGDVLQREEQRRRLRESCVICTPARLSSVQFRRRRAGLIGCADYDGVVSEWDIERGCATVEREEHGGRHIWSLHYSSDDLCVSASDDGNSRIWPPDCERSTLSIASPSRTPICCAEFSPSCSNRVAIACADGCVYVHDLRHLGRPLLHLGLHDRAVSYVRFLSHSEIASMSIDSSIAVWKIDAEADSSAARPPRAIDRFRGHHNVKNFVGLSVLDHHSLLACGSETNQAFLYERNVGPPILRHELSDEHPIASAASDDPFYDIDVDDIPPQRRRCLRPFSQRRSSSMLDLHQLDEERQRRRASAMDRRRRSGSTYSSSRTGESAVVSSVCWRNPSQSSSSCTFAAANSDGVLHMITGHCSFPSSTHPEDFI